MERPIPLSGADVRAILEGRKTQTRRPLRSQGTVIDIGMTVAAVREHLLSRCPYGAPGDRLWVRETWACMGGEGSTVGIAYAARLPPGKTLDDTDGGLDLCQAPPEWQDRRADDRWRPSIHMPRWASRLTLEVVSVRVERLQEISNADKQAEGLPADACYTPLPGHMGNFAVLWNEINGKRAPWESNPWVWVITFKRAQ